MPVTKQQLKVKAASTKHPDVLDFVAEESAREDVVREERVTSADLENGSAPERPLSLADLKKKFLAGAEWSRERWLEILVKHDLDSPLGRKY